jgi:uncharacterized protein DUF6069
LAARAIAVAVLPPVDPRFVELLPQSIIIMTAPLCAMAVAVFALVARFARRPVETYRIVAAVALVLSWIPDLMIVSQPGGTTGGVVALVVLHAVAAVAVVWTLERLTTEA